MADLPNPFQTLQTLPGTSKKYYSLPALEEQGVGKISSLPVLVRVMLESLLRNCDGKRVREEDIVKLAKWKGEEGEVPFVVSRVLLQDFTGVPLVVDLAAMRDVAASQGKDPNLIQPHVPVDLVIDHSVQVDRSGRSDAFAFNVRFEFERNQDRYTFLKWGQKAFSSFRVIPPGIGICHQVNLEYLATVVTKNEDDLLYLDTLVGTDSHTTMVNGMGVVGWGVGGIEAEAAMLGQPVNFPLPEVIGVHLTGRLREGVTATDLTLRVTEMLRKENVVGKFVEFFGEGAASLSVADRATIGNMAPEYGATTGYFPVDEKTIEYLRLTGRSAEQITLVEEYLRAQNLFGMPKEGEIDYSKVLELDMSTILPCVAGPKRPQDRLEIGQLKPKFLDLLQKSVVEGGYGKKESPTIHLHGDGKFSLQKEHKMGGLEDEDTSSEEWSESEMVTNRPFSQAEVNPGYAEFPCDTFLTDGSVVIAAITSCTNTSNPSVMVAAGLVAQKAVEKKLSVNPAVKASLAPGSRVVSDYLTKSGLQDSLDKLGFQLVAYGCTTCIGNSGPLDETIEEAIKEHDLITASVLSGNRNFEARIHSSVKANFLMSPPLVVAYAIAGRVDIDLEKEPLGLDHTGSPVFLKDLWPTSEEIESVLREHLNSSLFTNRYSTFLDDNPTWNAIETTPSALYDWDPKNTYIQNPPYFEGFTSEIPARKGFEGMRCLAIFGDSVTTDHISPAGAFKADTPAGKYLLSLGISEKEFNSYGSRRGNHNVMMRGTFANIRIRNQMADGKEGGFTKLLPEGKIVSIFEAAEAYGVRKVPLILFAGRDYGMGSSRDWAAKGTALLGVRAVVAASFERIHRSNLVGMGVLPLEFPEGMTHETLQLTGEEIFSLRGLEEDLHPRQQIELEISRENKIERIPLRVRLDTPLEVDYYLHGGIMPYVVRKILSKAGA
ncbi:MAG: Aconitate hydratase A [Chlamydiae bacterium]|nr:Aconitate hydratase A [Chlamydiota bacterium]